MSAGTKIFLAGTAVCPWTTIRVKSRFLILSSRSDQPSSLIIWPDVHLPGIFFYDDLPHFSTVTFVN